MKRQLQGAISIFLVLILIFGLSPFAPLLGVVANAASESDLTFSLINNGTEYGVRKCNTSAAGELVIPSTYNGLPVTRIERSALFDCSNLTSISIPDSVTGIGEFAFARCSSLKMVAMTDSVASIGIYAFYGCTNLLNITLPNGLASIEVCLFYDCSSLESIIIPDSVTSIGNQAFLNCTRLSSVTIGSNVKEIGLSVFGETPFLSNAENYEKGLLYMGDYLIKVKKDEIENDVHIKKSTKAIAGGAFANCNKISCVSLPYGITSIEYNTFQGCTELISVIIPDSVKSIKSNAFKGCSMLTDIIIPDSVMIVGDGVFENCTNLKNVDLSDNISEIGSSFFRGCTSLSTISIPDNVKSIGCFAFENTALYNDKSNWKNEIFYIGNHLIVADSNITEANEIKYGTMIIADNAFNNCLRLSTITIPGSLKCIGKKAFGGCTALSNIAICNGVTNIGEGAFSGCDKLAEVIIPDSVITMGEGIFYDCSNLSNVTIGKSVTSIGGCAFQFCERLSSVYLPENVTYIGENAFYYCSSLKNISISENVSFIGEGAFDVCTSLESIKISENNKHYCNDSYGILYDKEKTKLIKCPMKNTITSYQIPNGVVEIGSYAFENCNSLESLMFFDSVKLIDEGAFSYCTGLKEIFYCGSEKQHSKINIGDRNQSLIFATWIYSIVSVEKVTVLIKTCLLDIRETLQLSAVVSPDNATNKEYVWSSSNEAVATVSESGLVTAISEGTATITATTVDGEFTDSCVVTVTIPVEEIAVSQNKATLDIRETLQLSAVVTPNNATNKEYVWSSSNESVATVSESGIVTAISEGTATITATTVDGEFTDSCVVTVTIPVEEITVSQNKATLDIRETLQLFAVVSPDSATNKEYVWSSSNESVATVSESGIVTAISEGTATITATSVDGNKTAVCVVSVSTEILHKTLEPENKSAGVVVDYPSGCFGVEDSKVTLRVENISQEKFAAQGDFRKIEGNMMIGLYNISPMDDMGNVIQPNCKVTVIIQAPHGYYDGDKVTVVHWRRDGKTEKFNAVVTNGIIEVQTDCFSEFGIYREMTVWEKIMDFFATLFRNIFSFFTK